MCGRRFLFFFGEVGNAGAVETEGGSAGMQFFFCCITYNPGLAFPVQVAVAPTEAQFSPVFHHPDCSVFFSSLPAAFSGTS